LPQARQPAWSGHQAVAALLFRRPSAPAAGHSPAWCMHLLQAPSGGKLGILGPRFLHFGVVPAHDLRDRLASSASNLAQRACSTSLVLRR
jgi:hypothetical protein